MVWGWAIYAHVCFAHPTILKESKVAFLCFMYPDSQCQFRYLPFLSFSLAATFSPQKGLA